MTIVNTNSQAGGAELLDLTAPSLDVAHWAEVLTFAARLADSVHDTEFVPKALRGRPEAVAATVLYGAEVGITPMQALAGIHIVEGRPAPSAELMRALVFRAGHNITVHEATGMRCRVSGLRRGRPETERRQVEWNVDMARSAGLLGKKNWREYPRAMLLARATGDLCREMFPDVIKGLGYVAEDAPAEVEAVWGAGPVAPPPEVAAPEKPRRLGRAPRAKPEPEQTIRPVEDTVLPPEPEPQPDPELPPVAPLPADATGGTGLPKPSEPVPPGRGPYDPEDIPLPPSMQPQGTGRPVRGTVSLPDPEPEDTPPEPATGPGPRLIGAGPLKAINTRLTEELGSVATPEERRGLVSAILGGAPVDSLRELTPDQGYRTLATLDRFRTGEAGWHWDQSLPPPGIRVEDLRPEPEQEP